jgi:hypothetical protein
MSGKLTWNAQQVAKWPSTKPVKHGCASAGRPRRASRIWYDVVGPAAGSAIAQEGLPHVAEPHHARAAMEERCADVVFKLLHAAGDHRLGHAHLPRRLREALGLRDATECLYVFEAVHGLAMYGGPSDPL